MHRPLKILVAEDNRVNQMLARKALSADGHSVVIAENGQIAIDELLQAEVPFDLVLMDCQMPVLDGIQATAKIRELQSAGHIPNDLPIIAVTATDLADADDNSLSAMDDCLSKPFTTDELVDIVHKHTFGQTAATETKPETSSANVARKPFTMAKLLDISGGDRETIDHFIGLFHDSGASCLAQIQSAIQSGDIATARSAGHSLKGASGMLGAEDVFRLSKELESFNGSVDELREKAAQLSAALDECRKFESVIHGDR